jgi:hypothetical protein
VECCRSPLIDRPEYFQQFDFGNAALQKHERRVARRFYRAAVVENRD